MAQGVPLVSYLLVNWRTEELLPRALKSIRAQTAGITEIVLVDNGSPGFDPAVLVEYGPFKLISNKHNLGFAAANNQAFIAASGDIVVLLNCDAYLHPEFTRHVLAVFAANPRIGTVVPKVLCDDGSGRIDSTGHMLRYDRTAAHRGRGERDQSQYDAGGFVFGGSAAAIAYRREMLDMVAEGGEVARGGRVFDESFFAYYEDVDLDWRANLAGWRAYYEPQARAQHRGHGSGGRASYAIRLHAEKNRYLMLAKNDTLGCQLARWWPLLLYECWHLLGTLLQPWLWPAYLSLLDQLPRAWARRRRARPVVAPAQVAGMFVPRGQQPPPRAEPAAVERGLLETDAEAAVRSEMTGAAAKARRADEVYPLVSVVVVNYNGLALTRRCLEALQRQSYAPLELIVVDNGSVVDEAELLGVSFPAARTLRLARNQGFAGGVNWGVSLARGEYVVLINNDAIPAVDCVRQLVYTARRSGAAAVSGRLVDIHGQALVDPALAALAAELGGAESMVGEPPAAVAQALAESRRNHGFSLFGYVIEDAYGEAQKCFYPSGALCVFKRAAIAGLLPELVPQRFFAYHEDAYLGFRLRARGALIAKEPRAAAVHLAGSTARRLGRTRLRYLMERNRCLNLLGFMPGGVLAKLLPLAIVLDLLSALPLLLGRPFDFAGWLAARLWLVMHPVELARWRRRCRAEAAVRDVEWLQELSGKMRGADGVLNELTLAWCRQWGVPHRERGGQTG